MKQTVLQLLTVQVAFALIFTVIAVFIAGISWQAVLAGSAISCTATASSFLVIRKLPQVLGAKNFYRVMLVCESFKWLSVGIFTSVLLIGTNLQALGIVIGFTVNYFGSHLMTFLLMK
ncbi:MAG: hypothetical protein J6M05_00715 [Cardiobacteriaceae bacterium]|nr:hypothetical protein [Cardiobacteriaceae bacterium]